MAMEYRLSCEYKTDLAKQKGYKNSYEVTNETTSQLLAQCDVVGYVSHDAIAVKDDLGGIGIEQAGNVRTGIGDGLLLLGTVPAPRWAVWM